ncbi:hypothetical protein F7725_000213, partial [Dissostichus mawsoni]
MHAVVLMAHQPGHVRRLVDSILDAVLTVSPNRQYLGIFSPQSSLTCVDAGSQLQPLVGHVRDGDLPDGGHQVQRHLGDLISVSVPIPLRQTAHH